MEMFNQSSSPLSSLMPQSSPYQMPNYANALKMNTQPQMDNLKFKVGLATSNSSNPLIAQKGKSMMSDAMNPDSSDNQLLQKNDSGGAGFNWSQGFNALSQIGDKIGGQAGNVLNSAGKIGSSIQMISQANKGIKAGLKGAKAAKAGGIGAAVGAASDLIGSFMPEKTEYAGAKGNITQSMDSVYDGISDAAMSFGPIGMMVGGIMKGGKLLGQGVNALGGGTDGMTGVDAVLGSSFLNLTPLGLINGFGGKKANTITKDSEAFDQVGSSYTGSESSVNDALQKSGKKYGLFSNKARKQANEEIAEAARQQSIISDISQDVQDRMALKTSMSAINGNRRQFNMQGGYDQASVQVGRHGMSLELLEKARSIIKAQQGTKTLDPFQVYLQSLPENQRDSTNYRVRDYWEYNGKPRNFEEAIKKGMFVKQEDFDNSGKSLGKSWHGFTVAENPNTGELEFMKSYTHPTIQKELDWYNSDDGTEFRNQYELVKTKPYYKYVKRKTPVKQETPQHRNGGSIIKLISETTINLVNPLDIPEFQNGGSINIIPEGALHARKHNMNLDGVTEKGIPVVSNDGKQQAEIEKEEIIFRLEVTKKLEELEKKYNDDNSSQKEKDQCALEAGKLLVKEILHNTDDKTGLINTLKKGGVIEAKDSVQQSDIDKMVKQALINILIQNV